MLNQVLISVAETFNYWPTFPDDGEFPALPVFKRFLPVVCILCKNSMLSKAAAAFSFHCIFLSKLISFAYSVI